MTFNNALVRVPGILLLIGMLAACDDGSSNAPEDQMSDVVADMSADIDGSSDLEDADLVGDSLTDHGAETDVDSGPTDLELVQMQPWNRTIRCPGDPQCADDSGPLHVGFASRVITPPVETYDDANGNGVRDEGEPYDDANDNGEYDPTYMATGNLAGGREARAVHDDLWVRAVVFRRGDTTVALAVWDTFGLFHEEIIAIRQKAADAGLDIDHIMVATTHNHNSFDSVGIDGPDLTTGRNPEHNEAAQDMTVEAITEALNTAEPATIEAASVDTPEEWTRDSRLPIFIDRELRSLRAIAEDGSVLGTVVLWSNHVEAAGISNTIITSDYPSRMREVIEAADPGSTAVFFPGMVGGLMTPLGVPVELENGTITSSNDIEKADRMGELLGDEVLASFEGDTLVVDDDPMLGLRRLTFPHQIQNLGLLILGQQGAINRNGYDENGMLLPREDQGVLGIDVYVLTEVNAIDVGPVQIVTIPGELYPELGVRGPDGEPGYQTPIDPAVDYPDEEQEPIVADSMREDADFHWVMGLANDFTGYILPVTQWDTRQPFAYERDEPQYGESFSASYLAARNITESIVVLLSDDFPAEQ